MSIFSEKNVAITGRLSTMTRAEAIQHLGKAGAVFAKFPNKTTSFLVAGQADGPLGKNGMPSRKLKKARKMQQECSQITIITETEFLKNVGLEHLIEYLDQFYTAAQLKRIVGVSANEIRAWIRQKLLRPAKVSRKLQWFDFKEVMIARTLHELTNSGVKLSTVKTSLDEMSRWLPDARNMLNQAESYNPKGLQIRLPAGAVRPDGQMLLDFTEKKKALIKEIDIDTEESADNWFAVGVAADDSDDFEQAAWAYEQALRIGGLQAETCFNLGNVYAGLDRKSDAAQRYLQAVEIDPEYVEAWNNLGNVLSDIGKLSDAIEAYKTALKYETHYADAHWNIAETYEQIGQLAEARRHWEAYLEQDPHSSAAAEIRSHLKGLGG